jgi:uncharacterized protein with GYD domain
MATYVTLIKFTKKGMANIREIPAAYQITVDRMAELGGELLAVYYTMGEYDLVAISEWASDEACLQFAVELGYIGNLRTQNLKAFSQEEFAQAVAALPAEDE